MAMDWRWDGMQAVGGGEGPVGAKGRDSGRVNGLRQLYALVANGGEKQLGTRLPIGARGDEMGCEALSARDGGGAAKLGRWPE